MIYWIQTVTLVAVGGASGALARYGMQALVLRVAGNGFPLGTLVVNIVGSFIMGLIAAYLLLRAATPEAAGDGAEVDPKAVADAARLQALIATGFLGSFTTFSTFSLDAIKLLEAGRFFDAASYILGSVLIGVLAVAAGLLIGRSFLG